MASAFQNSADDTRCERCYTEDTAHVSYRVEVKQNMCDGCARDKQGSIITAEWFCHKHITDKAKIFCLTHDVPICEACAITIHKSSCTLGEIEDTLKDRKDDLVRLIEASKTNEETFSHQMKSVDEEVGVLEQHFAREEEKLRLAHEREEKKLNETSENRQRKLKEASTKIRDISKNLRNQPEKKCKELVEMRTRAEALLTNKSDLMRDFQEISNSLTSLTNQSNPDTNVKDVMKRVMGVAQKVCFTETESHGIGTIEPVETWVRNDEYTQEIKAFPFMMGAISETEVVIKGTDKHSIYIVDVEAKTKTKSTSQYDLCRCVPLKDVRRRIVCGSNDGEVIICDRSWKALKVIRVANKKSVCVAVNKDGLILANSIGSGMIGLYDPADGKPVRSIMIKTPIYDMCALASGQIVILNECVEGIDVTVLDNSGETLASKHCHGEGIKSLAVDFGHDLIYCLSWDRHHSDYKVCVLSTSAEFVAERVIVSKPWSFTPSYAIPRPDRMVIYTDGKLLTYSKTERGLNQLLAEIKLREGIV